MLLATACRGILHLVNPGLRPVWTVALPHVRIGSAATRACTAHHGPMNNPNSSILGALLWRWRDLQSRRHTVRCWTNLKFPSTPPFLRGMSFAAVLRSRNVPTRRFGTQAVSRSRRFQATADATSVASSTVVAHYFAFTYCSCCTSTLMIARIL